LFGSDRSVRLTVAATLDGFEAAMNRGSAAARSFSKNVQRSSTSAAQALTKQKEAAETVAKPLLAIGTIAALGVGYAIKSYADFEEKMSSVKSLSHATTDEMNQLKQAALTSGTAIGLLGDAGRGRGDRARQGGRLRLRHLRRRSRGLAEARRGRSDRRLRRDLHRRVDAHAVRSRRVRTSPTSRTSSLPVLTRRSVAFPTSARA
jgi:hypothetical protein